MPISEGTGLGTPLQSAGAPVAGTDEVQTLTVTGVPTGGTFRLGFGGFTTAAIAFNATATAVVNALNALNAIGALGVSGTGGPLPTAVAITFAGAQVTKRNQPLITLADNSLTGGTTPTVTIAETTAGVAATGAGAPKGALLIRLDTGVLMINTGTPVAPTWVSVGSQT